MSPSKIRKKGRDAYDKNTDPELLCPYRKGSVYWKYWMEGWKEGEKIYKEISDRAVVGNKDGVCPDQFISKHLVFKVDVKVGARIESVANEACQLAKRLQASVEFKFNGVICVVKPNANYLELVGKYYLELSNDNPVKVAVVD